jgi:hypothetical protein
MAEKKINLAPLDRYTADRKEPELADLETRYLAEFDYRYNERMALGMSDADRMSKSIAGIVGKRLTYRRTNEAKNHQA